MSPSRIVAIGGTWIGTDAAGQSLLQFLLQITGRDHPRVLLIPTATGDNPADVVHFYAACAGQADARHLALFGRTSADLRSQVLENDLILVSGGNTANLLAVWRVHEVDTVLREAWHAGVVLAGSSAGALCWFSSGVTDSFGPRLRPLDGGLGFLDGSFCPHYDAEPGRRPAYRELVGRGVLPPGFALDDDAALVFEGTELVDTLAFREGALAYRVERGRRSGESREIPLSPRLILQPGPELP